jgi:hypothetical protein
MGMVTPLNEAHLEDIPEGIQTRMILYLKPDMLSVIEKKLGGLPPTLLLFLKNLRKLSLSIELEGSDKPRTAYVLNHVRGKRHNERVRISKTEDGRDSADSDDHFWVFRQTESGLPEDPSRPDIDTAEVVLAFPLDSLDRPIVEESLQQWISAYLPMRQEDFKVRLMIWI